MKKLILIVCTSTITSTQRDAVKQAVRDRFGWELELFDLERVRIRLATELRYLIAQHPSIFSPPWFPTRGGLSISESRDTLVIDHISDDHALATWLARRLQLAGYRTWCYGNAASRRRCGRFNSTLIEKRAAHYVPILSPA